MPKHKNIKKGVIKMRVDEIELGSYENLLDLLKPGGTLNLHYNEFIYIEDKPKTGL